LALGQRFEIVRSAFDGKDATTTSGQHEWPTKKKLCIGFCIGFCDRPAEFGQGLTLQLIDVKGFEELSVLIVFVPGASTEKRLAITVASLFSCLFSASDRQDGENFPFPRALYT